MAAIPPEPRLTAAELFPRAARIAPHLAVVDGDAAETLARAAVGWELPNFATAAAYRLNGAPHRTVPIATALSVGVAVREPRPDANPMVAGMLALAAARRAVLEVMGDGEPLEAVWPAELRRRGRRLVLVTVEPVHDGVVVGVEFDVRVGLGDPLLEAFLLEYADLIARYQLVGGDLGLAGLSAAIREVTQGSSASSDASAGPGAPVIPLVSRFAPPTVREVRHRFTVAEDEAYELDLTA